MLLAFKTKTWRVHDYANEIDADKKNVSVYLEAWGGEKIAAVVFCDRKKNSEPRHKHTKKKMKIKVNVDFENLLSFLSQLSTLAFQSHVCFSMSNAKPEGQVICFSPELVHLCVHWTFLRNTKFHYQSFRRIRFSFVYFQVFFVCFVIQCYQFQYTLQQQPHYERTIMRQQS